MDRDDLKDQLESQGWRFLNASDGLQSYSEFGDPRYNGDFYISAGLLSSLGKVAEALVAESSDGDSLVISFAGTDDKVDWAGNIGLGLGLPLAYLLFSPLFQALEARKPFSEYQHIYVTGHSLGGAMVEAFKIGHGDADNVEAIAFANPGYPTEGGPADHMINITVGGDVIQLVQALPELQRIGDDYIVLHPESYPSSTLHNMNLYMSVASYLDQNATQIFSNDVNGHQEESQPIWARISADLAAFPLNGATVYPDGVDVSTAFNSSPGDGWSAMIDTGVAATTPALVVSSSTYTNAHWNVSALDGKVAISDVVRGNVFLYADNFVDLSRPPANGRWNGLFAWDEGRGGKHAGKIEAYG